MSAAAAVARIGEIQALIGTMRAAPPAASAPPSATSAPQSFQTLLASNSAQPLATTAGDAAGAGGATQYDGLIQAAAQRNGVDPALLKGLIRQESNFDPNAGSGAGAVGLTQLMPGTAASLGVSDPRDPAQSIEGGAKYLRQQLDAFGGDEAKALAAYNAGPGAVQRYGGVPPYAETQSYVQRVLGYAQSFRSQSPTEGPSTT
jgi:soluble lytic murein transglycosylase-like protein